MENMLTELLIRENAAKISAPNSKWMYLADSGRGQSEPSRGEPSRAEPKGAELSTEQRFSSSEDVTWKNNPCLGALARSTWS